MAHEISPPKREVPRKSRSPQDKLWRLFGWGGTAALALTALAMTTQTDTGRQRLRLAFATSSEPARVAAVAPPPRETENDIKTRALEVQLGSLAADRDRLSKRLASLEHHLDDLTGSIRKQATQQRAIQTVPAPAVTAPAPVPGAPAIAAATPASAAPAKQVASLSSPPVIDPLAMPLPANVAMPWPVHALPQPQAHAAMRAVPLPPARLVALPPGADAGEPIVEPPPAPKLEYGIELGSGPNINVLRARWSAVKASLGPLLGGLQPVAVRDRRPGSTNYLLIAGPVPSFAAAHQACARFAAAHVACRPARFDKESMVQR